MLVLPAGALLAGDRLLRTFAGAGVGARALAVDRQTLAVTQTLVTPDFHLALDVLRDLAAQVTFDLDVLVDVAAQPRDFFLGEVAHARVARHAGRVADLLRDRAADAVDVRERDLQPLLAGDVDTGDSSHRCSSALTLLVARVDADDPDRTVPANHLALVAHLLDRRSNLHRASFGLRLSERRRLAYL